LFIEERKKTVSIEAGTPCPDTSANIYSNVLIIDLEYIQKVPSDGFTGPVNI